MALYVSVPNLPPLHPIPKTPKTLPKIAPMRDRGEVP
jgi:hypothetical protein